MATEKEKVTENLKEMLKSAINEYGIIGVTTDLWTDVKQRSYVSLTAHFVNNENLQSQVLSVFEFGDDAKTGQNLNKNIVSGLKQFGITSSMLMNNIYFVTDEGSNIKSALACYHRQPCACHRISTVLKHTLQLDKLSKSVHPISENDLLVTHVEMLRKTVNASKALATYCKKSGLNNKLSCSIKQSNETRWNSLLVMLKSIKKVETEVKDLLEEVGEIKRLDEIDFALIDILINFLEPFQQATLALEGDLYPTSHHVFQWYTKLERSVRKNAADSPILDFLKERASHALHDKFIVTPLHKMAFMFNPKFKSMRAFSEDMKTEVIDLARSLLQEQINDQSSSNKSDVADTSKNTVLDHVYENRQNQINSTSKSSIDDEFCEWQDEETFKFDGDELNLYLLHHFKDDFTNNFFTPDGHFDILKFWLSAEIRSKFPDLSRLVIGVLSIPASSSSSERAFSCCGTTVSKKRTRLSTSTVDSIITLNSNWK